MLLQVVKRRCSDAEFNFNAQTKGKFHDFEKKLFGVR